MKTLREIRKILAAHKKELKRKYTVKEIGIFGSYVREEQKKKSDIDILVIKTGGKIRGIERFYLKLRREPNIHIFSLSEWKKQARENKAFYQDVISTGINLIGEMPLV